MYMKYIIDNRLAINLSLSLLLNIWKLSAVLHYIVYMCT